MHVVIFRGFVYRRRSSRIYYTFRSYGRVRMQVIMTQVMLHPTTEDLARSCTHAPVLQSFPSQPLVQAHVAFAAPVRCDERERVGEREERGPDGHGWFNLRQCQHLSAFVSMSSAI